MCTTPSRISPVPVSSNGCRYVVHTSASGSSAGITLTSQPSTAPTRPTMAAWVTPRSRAARVTVSTTSGPAATDTTNTARSSFHRQRVDAGERTGDRAQVLARRLAAQRRGERGVDALPGVGPGPGEHEDAAEPGAAVVRVT